jgi:flagellar basal-body rod protein FlgF
MPEVTGYITLSRQMAMERQMEVIANNLANMNSTGYKTESVLFEEYLETTPEGDSISYVRDYGTSRDLAEGEFTPTENPMDIAITKGGYLSVQTDTGLYYSRNGNLRLDAEGQLVTDEGFPILDEKGQPVTVEPEDPTFEIATDGTISNSLGPLTKLAVFSFENEQNLSPVGSGLYQTEDTPIPPEGISVIQGMLETSNVLPIKEITKMIDLSRSYQSTANLMQEDADLLSEAIESLGRV